ncbi:MAG: PAS domain S-box protein [Methanoregula sp.]
MFSVLYVDDERDLLELGKIFLEQSPEFHIEIALSAKEALELPAIQSFDAIVSDYQMPDMNGIEFLKAVREQFGDVPFILFTGRGREGVVIDAINHGADFYLQKGGDVKSQFAELSHKIRQAVARRRAEHSLVESEKRLADIIDFLPDATFAINREGFIIAWNRAIEEMTGNPAVAMLGKGDYEYAIPFYGKRRPILIDLVLAPDDEIAPFYDNILRQGVYLTAETNLPHPKGSPITVLAKASPLYNREGQITGAIEAVRDITERKKAEDKLRAAYEQISASEEELREQYEELAETGKKIHESEKKYRDLFENSVIGIFRTSFEGKFSAINATFARIAGYDSPQEMIDAVNDIRTQLYVDPEDRTRFSDQLKSEGKVKDFKARFYHRDGHMSWVKINAIAVRDPQGTVQYYEGTIEDIDDQKKAEAALKKEKTFSDAVIDSVPGLLYLYDSDGRLIRWNKSHETITGYTAEELAGMHLLDWYKGDDKAIEIIRAGVDRALREGYASAEADLQTKSGKKIPFFLTAQRLEIEGKIYFTGVGIDITDRKKARDELRTAYEQVTATEGELRAQYEELARREQRIRESEEKYRCILENIQDVYYRSDADGNLIMASPSILGLLGYDRLDELIGKNIAQDIWLYPERRQIFIEEIKKKGSVTNYEIIIRRKDSRPVIVATSSHFYYNHDGSIGGVEGIFYDITAVKEANQQIHLLAGLIDISPASVTVHDADGKFLYANQRTFTLHGYTREEFMALNLHEIDVPLSEELINQRIESLKMTGEASFDVEHFRKDGSRLPLHVTAKITRWNDREVIMSVAMDLSERIKAERILFESEEKFRKLFEQSNDAIFIADPKTQDIIDCNRKAELMTGFSHSEILGMQAASFHPEDLREMTMEHFREFLEGMTSSVESEVLTRDGGRVPVSINAWPVDVGGRILLIGTFRDITRQKRAEEALRESEERYRTVVENIEDAFLRSNAEGLIVMASPSAARMLGYDAPEELIGKLMAGFYQHPKVRQSLIEKIARDGNIVDQTIELQRKDGSTFWGSVNAHFLHNENGEVNGTEGFIHDITEYRAMEQAFHEASHKLSLLNSMTRHDVVNQLTILQGYAQIAALKKGDPVITDYLAKIITAADTIARQIEFTRMYQELGGKAPAWMMIGDIIAHVESRVPVTISGTCRGIEIFADPMLERVFFNLFDNAIRHGVRVTEITVRCEREPDSLLVIVEDNGTGIPVEVKEKIFERGIGKNTGLGLFLAREILAITGITIRETGIFGKGARFELSVPAGKFRYTG